MSFRTRASASPRQPPSSAILFYIRWDAFSIAGLVVPREGGNPAFKEWTPAFAGATMLQRLRNYSALTEAHHRLDLHLHPRDRQLAHADQRARRARGAEELLPHRVDRAAVVHVEEVDRHLQDVGEARARGVEHELHVLEHLPS